ncbi:MAG: hypothetical protein OEQ18_18280 [Gammaproteobacteria bacterium]|nr:hypothetical protein [Gammaproteobacteria bacterium]
MLRRALILVGYLVFGISALTVEDAAAKSFKVLRTGIYAVRTDMLMNALAKELCSCVNVAEVGKGRPILEAVEICLERAQLPITPGIIKALTGTKVGPQAEYFEVDTTVLGAMVGLFQGSAAIAHYDPGRPQFGCSLTAEKPR